MSIDPILPVNMSGAIVLNSSELSTWMPVIASTIAGVFSAIVTFLIVRWTSKDAQKQLENSYQLTVDSIVASNKKTLKEMKASIESSKEITLMTIAENRLIEDRKREAEYHKEWVNQFSIEFSKFIGSHARFGCHAIENEHSATDYSYEELNSIILEMVTCMSRLYSLLDVSNQLHEKFYEEICSLKNKALEKLRGASNVKVDFYPDRLFQLHWAILAEKRAKIMFSVSEEAA